MGNLSFFQNVNLTNYGCDNDIWALNHSLHGGKRKRMFLETEAGVQAEGCLWVGELSLGKF